MQKNFGDMESQLNVLTNENENLKKLLDQKGGKEGQIEILQNQIKELEIQKNDFAKQMNMIDQEMREYLSQFESLNSNIAML